MLQQNWSLFLCPRNVCWMLPCPWVILPLSDRSVLIISIWLWWWVLELTYKPTWTVGVFDVVCQLYPEMVPSPSPLIPKGADCKIYLLPARAATQLRTNRIRISQRGWEGTRKKLQKVTTRNNNCSCHRFWLMSQPLVKMPQQVPACLIKMLRTRNSSTQKGNVLDLQRSIWNHTFLCAPTSWLVSRTCIEK